MHQLDLAITSLGAFWAQLGAFVPKLIAAIILLLVGWITAKLIRAGIMQLLKIARFDKLAEKSGIDTFLEHGEIHFTLSRLLSELVYWLVILVTIVTVANSLGLHIVADLFNKVVLFIPNILVAILVLVFGTLLARFINRLIFAYLKNIGMEGALTLSTLSEYAVQIFVIFVALEQLRIGTQLLTAAFQIAFGAICFALALAFGLGGKEWAAEVIAKLSRHAKREP